MKIDIIIPTYNRPRNLHSTIQALSSQIDAGVTIFLLDNASEPAVTHASLGISSDLIDRVIIRRNCANIGGDANILRCFEVGNADYFWLLGDDDVVAPDAVRLIRDAIVTFPKASFHNFSFHHRNFNSREVSGLSEFINEIDRWGAILLISNGVYRVADFHASLMAGYRYSYAYAPHVAVLLESLGARSLTAVFHPQAIVLGNAENPGNAGWSLVRFAETRMLLLDLLSNEELRTALGRKIFADVRIFNHTFVYCLQLASSGRAIAARRTYARIVRRNAPFAPFAQRLRSWVFLFILKVWPLALLCEYLGRSHPHFADIFSREGRAH